MQDAARLVSTLTRRNAPAPNTYSIRAATRVSFLALGFALACSSQSGGNQPTNNAGSSSIAGSAGQSITGGASSSAGSSGANAGSSGSNAGSSALSAGTGGAPNASSGGTAGAAAGDTAGAAGGPQCRDNVPAAEWQANCLTCAGADSCAQCTCTKCADTVQTCETTPGCKEIAVCVRANACTGAQCYCGTVDVLQCANGGGNGPCKDIILAAPGGKPPTVADPSAGPASDALIAVNTCRQNASTCGSVCM